MKENHVILISACLTLCKQNKCCTSLYVQPQEQTNSVNDQVQIEV